MEEDGQLTADGVTAEAEQRPAIKKSVRRLTLTRFDKRFRFGKRVTELVAIFAAEMQGELSPLRKLKLERAAQLVAIAEQERGAFMRNGGSMDNMVRLEHKADTACRALGIDLF
jgi:hypothetical protein